VNEYEIVEEKVRPYMQDTLGWPEALISGYGRVPVQVGASTVWADFVCYMSQHQKALPWLLIEVKRPGQAIEEAVPQAESYAIILGTPFFAVTDGDDHLFYICGDSQGTSVLLADVPPLPSSEYLSTGVEFISFPPTLDGLVGMFFEGLRNEEKFLEDTRYHEESCRALHREVFQDIEGLSAAVLKQATADHMMLKAPNRNAVFHQIEQDLPKLKKVLRFLSDFQQGDPVRNIQTLRDPASGLRIEGAGIFFLTQLLAGAHPDEYVVLEEHVSKALRILGVTEVLVQNNTANGYIYTNEICKRLYHEKLKAGLGEYGFGLPAVHNFLWHYHAYFRSKGVWYP